MSHPWDAFTLAEWMREEDAQEVYHSSRQTPHDIAKVISKMDDTFTIMKGTQVVAMFGVVGTPGLGGAPWMLGTDDLKNCKSLLRECRVRLDAYLRKYGYLRNAVWSKNTVHIEWIKWLGFQFEGSDVRNGETFLHFHRRLNV